MTGVAIGGLLGGPWGAAIGAALTTPIGIFVETSLSPTQQTATIERYIFETLRNTIAAGAAGALTGWLNRLATPVVDAMASEVNRAFGGYITSAAIKAMSTAVSTSLKKYVELSLCRQGTYWFAGSSMRFRPGCSLRSGARSTSWSRN